MPLAAGTRLGPYEILGAIGAGGMGEVYRARDTRLGRTVAVKVLRNWDGSDPDQRARFEREAKIVATLDHPHICALHDVGREGDVDYLVMPFLSGETLADRLAKGPLPIAQAIDIADQIADGLDRAHRQGVVHRDLKPGNVMLTGTGVRLLDFGLARAEPVIAPADATDLSTRPALTMAGAIMGTLPYMSPEQIAGQKTDARTDIWAFGCVLYEMLAGRRPFDDSDRSRLIGAITAAPPPPLSTLRPDVPPALEALVEGALVKDREDRWQNMRDIRRLLALARTLPSGTVPSATARRPALLPIAILGAAAIVVAGLALSRLRSAPEAPLVRFDVDAGAGLIERVTDTNPYFAASPDGQRIALAATVEGRRDIWIKRIDSDRLERLDDTAGATSPFWSPDSQSVAFFAAGSLKRKALAGGAAQTLCRQEGVGASGTWGSSGVIVFTEWGTRRLMRVAESGGAAVEMRHATESDMSVFGWPMFLPDGRHFLFTRLDLKTNDLLAFAGATDSSDTRPIAGVGSSMAFANGRLLYWREGSVVAQPFDPDALTTTGEPVAIADGIHAFAVTGFAAFSASPTLLVYQAGRAAGRLVWTDRRGVQLDAVGPATDFTSIQLSRDGSRVVYSARDPRLGTNDVSIHDLARNITTRLTSEPGTENAPAWSPDGRTIVYAANRHGPPNLQAKSADGVGDEREVVPPSAGGPQAGATFTPDGRWLVFSAPNAGTDRDLMFVPVDGHAAPVPVVRTPGRDVEPRLSDDGNWLAFSSNVSGRFEVYVQPLHDEHGRVQVSRDGGLSPRWRRDSRELFFLSELKDRVFAADVAAAAGAIQPGAPHLLFERQTPVQDYDVAPDGQRLLFAIPDPVAERGTLSAILNWTELIKR